jgi:hypothetical protein
MKSSDVSALIVETDAAAVATGEAAEQATPLPRPAEQSES